VSDTNGPTLAEHLRLTPYQVLTMQQSWSRIKATAFQQVFKQLAQRNSTAKELFQVCLGLIRGCKD
jgi:uncharacterized protein YukE